MKPPVVDPRDPAAGPALRRWAEEAARIGGRVAREWFGTNPSVRLKADRSEVTDADEAAQAAIVDYLRRQRPDDALLTEETLRPELGSPSSPTPSADRLCWVIDPIDGTRNFIRGVPLFACSVGVMIGGEPVAGAVYDPVRDELVSADRGGPLLLNGRPHEPPKPWETFLESRGTGSQPAAPADAGQTPRPVVGLPSMPIGVVAERAHQWLDRYVCRCLGSTALHLAYVALGRLEAMLADNARLWDVAAGVVLVRAAGGDAASPNGQPLFPADVAAYCGEQMPIVAAGPRLRARLASL